MPLIDTAGLKGVSKPRPEEERWTVGLDPYGDEPITENKIRAEHGLPQRQE